MAKTHSSLTNADLHNPKGILVHSTGSMLVMSQSISTATASFHFIPESANTYTLGNAARPWKELYVSTSSINFMDKSGNTVQTLTATSEGITFASGSLVSDISGSTLSGSKLHIVGDAFIGGDLTLGDADTDSISIGADITSNLIPNADNTYDLGSSGKQWKDIYINGIGYIDQLGTDADAVTVYVNAGEIDGTVIGGESAAAATVTTLNATGATTLDGAVTLGNATGDDITVTGYVASNIIPKTDATHDLGTTLLGFNDIHLGSGGVINLDGGDVTLTHSVGKVTLGGDGTVEFDFANHEMTNVDINSGTIDGTTIGTASHTTIKGTTIDATTDFTIGGTVITDNTITDDGTLVIASTTATSFSDGNITNVGDIDVDSISVDDATVGLDIQFGGNTTLNKITLTDNLADALNITEGGNSYIKFITSNSSEQIVVGKNSTFNGTTIADLGTVSAATSITATDLIGTNIDGIIGADTARAGTFTAIVGTSLDVTDGNITNVGDIDTDSISIADATAGLDINFGGNTTKNTITLTDNLSDALNITEGSNSYIKFITTNTSEQIVVGKNSTFNGTTISDLGTVTTADIDGGNIDGTVIGASTPASGSFTGIIVTGGMEVRGNLTYISSSNLDIGDRIVTLNAGSAAGDGGLYVNDADTSETGSLLWDVSADRWIGGLKGSEVTIPTISSTDTFTNKTLTSPDINGGTIDGATIATSDITVGSGKTLDVSSGTLTTSAAQKEAIMEGAGANIDIGAYSLTAQTLVSDVTTGTAPLTVASTTVVTNLNADLLDGQTNSYYLDYGNFVIDDSEIPLAKLAEDALTVTAGAGLTGGGSITLGGSATVDVVGGDGITANANDVAVTAAQTTITSMYNTSLKIGRDSGGDWVDFGTDDNIKVYLSNVEEFRFATGGTFHADADVVAYSSTVASDQKLKTNIQDIKYGLDDVLKLQGREFDWKKEGRGHDVGFIAQEIQEVIPELVKEVDGLNGKESYLTVNYAALVPVLVESIKELKKEIDDLKSK
ncbi:MAG: tail fiber domain-containing protein [Pelagibacteraceae bacterium]|nr:tail fiber domain-containing protein [Pelagibacteraceae bacterium]